MKLSEINARLAEISDEITAIAKVAEAEGVDLSEDDSNKIVALEQEFDGLKEKQAKEQKIQDALAKMASERASREVAPSGVQPKADPSSSVSIPAVARSQKSKVFASNEDAYLSGMYLAALAGDRSAAEFVANAGFGDIRNDQSLTPAKGGNTVPTPLSSELINLIEDYGVARQKCRKVVMSASTWTVPKVSQHTTVYYPAEAAALTASDMEFSQVTLTAIKAAQLVLMSTEITEDSIISMVDTVVRDMAWNFAKAEDENCFNGGNGITGIAPDANVGDTNVANLAALALTDLTAVTGALSNFRGIRREWYMNQAVYHSTIQDLLHAAGGTDPRHIEDGGRPILLGYPVNFVEAIPAAPATGELVAVFGDMAQAVYFGDRRSVNFKVLNELYAANDQVGVMATERYDIVTANPESLQKITIT